MPTHYLRTNLRALRDYMGYSQQWVADSCHLSRSQYAGWERADAEPSLDNILRLAEYFNVSLHDLARLNRFDMQRVVKSNAAHSQLATHHSPL